VKGKFSLFVGEGKKNSPRFLCYELELVDERENKKTCYATGIKEIRVDAGFNLWSAVSTLRLTLREGKPQDSPVSGKGILYLRFDDFLRQLSTFRATNTERLEKQIEVAANFAQAFAKTLLGTVRKDLNKRLQKMYRKLSGVLSRDSSVNWWKRLCFWPAWWWKRGLRRGWFKRIDRLLFARCKRRLLGRSGTLSGQKFPLKVPLPCQKAKKEKLQKKFKELQFKCVKIRLTRYYGGRKGPVILAPGFGMSTQMFVADTIPTSLTEYLCRAGYEVWLLDYRASADLPAAKTQFTVDEIANFDFPAAIKTVLDKTRTGQKSVQIMAHCAGSMAFLMAMLADEGLKDKVRFAICSQVTIFPNAGCATELKAGMQLARLLSALDILTLTAQFDKTSWADRLLDQVFKLYPSHEERCDNPVCRRILFLYGETHKHDQLNKETHENIGEMFGAANMHALKHFSLMLRRDHVVDARGNNCYLPYIERLALPITFIHGADNQLFLPIGSELTYKVLCERNGRERNGKELYARYVIPGYAHLDCFIGEHAERDVFPLILAELERWP
jgi:pimeloyl-ACP methyl ester carboxylesterase